MKFDVKDIDKLTHLARVGLKKEQEEVLATQLTKILTWAEKLNDIDTKDVQTLPSINKEQMPIAQDKVKEGGQNGGNIPELVLSNGPEQAQNMFMVPKVVE